jgi:hypothetical protein
MARDAKHGSGGKVNLPPREDDQETALPDTGIGAAVTKGNTKTEQPGCEGLGAPVEETRTTRPDSTRPQSPGAREDLEGAPL